MTKAITAQELRRELSNSVRRFKFVKLDGSIREALGTRNISLIPVQDAPSHCEDISDKSVVYWDLERLEFRSVSIKSFVGIY